MKTNREMFLEKLKSADMCDFVNFITGYGKCTRCSNYYWDGNNTGCHQNINNSSCAEGISQFMESNIGENLQDKYQKIYSNFRSCFSATLGQQLATILFKANVVNKIENNCNSCKSNTCPSCKWFWSSIIYMSKDYANNLEKRYCENVMIFVSEILIPRIQDQELWIQAKLLVELILKDKKTPFNKI